MAPLYLKNFMYAFFYLTTRPASSLFNRTRSRRGPDLRPGGGAILLGTKSAWASPCKCWHYSHVPLNNYIVWIHLLGGFIYLLAFLVCCLRKVQLDHITLAVLLNSDHSNAHFRFFRGSLLQHTQFKRSSLTCMQNLYRGVKTLILKTDISLVQMCKTLGSYELNCSFDCCEADLVLILRVWDFCVDTEEINGVLLVVCAAPQTKNISIISNKTMSVLLQKITPHKKEEEHDEFCHFAQCNC